MINLFKTDHYIMSLVHAETVHHMVWINYTALTGIGISSYISTSIFLYEK